MVVVDTNVLAYLLIEGDRSREALALLSRDPDWRSEAFLLVEFSHLLATYVRGGALVQSQAQKHARALRVAVELSISAYDARFIAVAQILGVRLVTEDTRLRAAAPALTLSLADALAT